MRYVITIHGKTPYEKDFNDLCEVIEFVECLYKSITERLNKDVVQQIENVLKDRNMDMAIVTLGMPDSILPQQEFVLNKNKINDSLMRFSRITKKRVSQNNYNFEINIFAPALLATVTGKDEEVEIPFIKKRYFISIKRKNVFTEV